MNIILRLIIKRKNTMNQEKNISQQWVRECTLENIPDFSKEHISQLIVRVSIQSISQLLISLSPLLSVLESKPLTEVFLLPQEPLSYLQSISSFEAVALGGTFDYFHIGHQILLLQALVSAKKEIVVGVSGENLLQKKKDKECIQPIATRINSVREYINLVRPDLKVII